MFDRHQHPAPCATQFNRPILRGLWHKHFVQPAGIWENLKNHWKKNGRLERAVRDVPQDHLLHHIAIVGYSDRAGNSSPNAKGKLTGEWTIIYAKQSRGLIAVSRQVTNQLLELVIDASANEIHFILAHAGADAEDVDVFALEAPVRREGVFGAEAGS